MYQKMKVDDLHNDSFPAAITEATTISQFMLKNAYPVSAASANYDITLPNVVEASGCDFLFVPGSLSAYTVTIKDDAGNTVVALTNGDNPVLLRSAGESWAQFDEDTDT